MTEETRETDDRTLGEMSHTNPYTNETFGDTQTYNRGQFAATDGGERNAVSRPSSEASSDGGEDGAPVEEADADEQTMRDVDHTPPKNAPSANAAYMEGDENAEDE